MQQGVVPDNYKIARISPLYNKGASIEFGNYIPVSLLIYLYKILEKKQYVNN